MGNDVARLLAVRTTVVSDALDRYQLPGALLGISLLSGTRFAGPAFTVGYVDWRKEAPSDVGDYPDEVPPGAVVVIDNKARTDCSIWGSLTTQVAKRNGIAATVIDGACRDLGASREAQYAIAARGATPRTGKDRVTVASVGLPIDVAGIPIAPGDFILGDEDGIVAIPRQWASRVLDAAEFIQERENDIAAQISAGSTIAAARAASGYMSLQRPPRNT